jgi:hypothetical protein
LPCRDLGRRHLRIDAERQQLLFPTNTIFEAPPAGTGGVDQQVQATAASELVRLLSRLGIAERRPEHG